MLDHLYDKLFNKKKNEDDNEELYLENEDDNEELYLENEDDNEKGFGYEEKFNTNEFNDALIDYAPDEHYFDSDEEEYEEIEDASERKKNKLFFWSLIAFLILLLLLALILRGCVLTEGRLKKIVLDAPDIIYLDEKTTITSKASGSGNLSRTEHHFEVSNPSIVDLNTLAAVRGKRVENILIPRTTGEFILSVSSTLKDVKLAKVEKEIAICRRLTTDVFGTSDINTVLNSESSLNLDLGSSSKCYELLTYSSADEEILTIDENGNMFGKKEGVTTITISNGTEVVSKEVTVISDKNVVKVQGISTNKNKVTINVGSKETLVVTIKPDNATNKNLKWTSSNEGIVTVNNKGEIVGIGKGTAIITAETEDGGYKVLITVTVTEKSSQGTSSQTPTNNTAPSLVTTKIYSSNTNKNYAKLNDTITVKVIANKKMATKPSITIASKVVSVSCTNDNKECTGTLKVTQEIAEGNIGIKIYGYKDSNGNTGAVVTKTSDSSYVIVDKTNPQCNSNVLYSGNLLKIDFVGQDATSGIKSSVISNGKTVTYSCKKNVAQSFSIEKNNGIIKFTLTDCAGNVNYCSFDTSSGTTSETVTPKTYTVTINSSNTGVSKVSTSSVSCSTTGTSCNVSLPTITAKSNYTVVGFNTAKSATTATYKSGSTISISGNMTLYAIVKQQVTEVEEPDDTEDQEETPVTKTCKEYSRVSANSNNCGEYSSSVATTATVSSKSACTAKCDGVSNINCKSSVKKGTCSYKYCTQVLDHYNYKTTTSKSACTSEGGTVTGATTNGYTCKIPNNEENCTSQSSSATDSAACTKICTASAQKSGCSFTATSYTCSFTMRSGCKTTYNCTGISSKDGCTTKLSGSKCILYSLQ